MALESKESQHEEAASKLSDTVSDGRNPATRKSHRGDSELYCGALRSKLPAEVCKSSDPVSRSAAQTAAASETSHKRVAGAQKHNRRRTLRAGTAELEAECGARNTRTEGASGAGANHRTCQEEQLLDRPASVYLSRGPSSDFNGAACVEALVDCRFRGHVTCARCVC